jgi:murein L,D-transpeptidase YcbB/YkuD
MFWENLKSNLLILIFFGAVFGVGYWAVKTLQVNPDQFDKREIDARPMIVSEPAGIVSNVPAIQEMSPPTTTTTQPSNISSPNNQLKSELERLVADNVLMKSGARGTRVGTIQRFLNLYNNTNLSVDNDFGPGTENRLRDFQRKEGLTADGQAGPNTYRKMIEWLDKQ